MFSSIFVSLKLRCYCRKHSLIRSLIKVRFHYSPDPPLSASPPSQPTSISSPFQSQDCWMPYRRSQSLSLLISLRNGWTVSTHAKRQPKYNLYHPTIAFVNTKSVPRVGPHDMWWWRVTPSMIHPVIAAFTRVGHRVCACARTIFLFPLIDSAIPTL